MKRGRLIVFEGISGTGKETQAKLLQKYLATRKIKSTIVFHPSPSIKPVLRAQKTLTDQLVVLTSDRKGVVDSVIRPALSRGEWIISLRNYVSAYVYQGNGDVVKKIDVNPDRIFYFDIDPTISMQRILSRGEVRGKYETIKLLREKRKKYASVLKNIPHIIIDASMSIDAIHKNIVKYIR